MKIGPILELVARKQQAPTLSDNSVLRHCKDPGRYARAIDEWQGSGITGEFMAECITKISHGNEIHITKTYVLTPIPKREVRVKDGSIVRYVKRPVFEGRHVGLHRFYDDTSGMVRIPSKIFMGYIASQIDENPTYIDYLHTILAGDPSVLDFGGVITDSVNTALKRAGHVSFVRSESFDRFRPIRKRPRGLILEKLARAMRAPM